MKMAQEERDGRGAVRKGVCGRNGADYRLDNLWTGVQSVTHITKGAYVEKRRDAEGRDRDSQSTVRFALDFACVPCASRPSSSWSSLAGGAVCLGVGERRRREIVIWSPQRPRAASIARFGQECSRSPATMQGLRRKTSPVYPTFAKSSVLRVFRMFQRYCL